MGADEEYLDNLLKSVTADLAGEEIKPEAETVAEEETFSVGDLLGEKEPFFVENEDGEEEEISIDDLIFGNDQPEEEIADGDTALDIDAMLKELNLLNDDMTVSETEPTVAEEEESTVSEPVEDVLAEPFYSKNLDEELDEINTLLEKADNNEAIDEDVLSMFASAGADLPNEDEPFDLMSEINSQNIAPEVEDKKAEKERKRKEKEAEKAAKKAAKLAAKEQKKVGKEEKSPIPTEEETATQTQDASEKEESAFDNFQEVDEFDDIEALLGSLNMDDLEFATAPVTNASSVAVSEPEQMLSMDEIRADEDTEVTAENQSGPEEKTGKKKEGIFKRFVDFLMEEDEEEEEVSSKKKKKAAEGTTSDEADTIGIKEKTKNGKKQSQSKSKNGKNGQDDDDNEEDAKKGKKKAKKPKKEKQPKSEMARKFKVVDDGKKIGKAGGFAIVLLAVSLFAVVMLSNIIFSPMLAKNRAEKAFKEQDYETCYQELSGWELSESESEMRDFARVVLKMERRLDAYEQYKGLRQKLDALDSLMRVVANYDEIYQEALNCGAEGEVEARYEIVIGLLSEEYGLSAKEAKAIAALDSDVEYTRYLTAVVAGKGFSGLDTEDGTLPGLLPEEEELPDTKFSE